MNTQKEVSIQISAGIFDDGLNIDICEGHGTVIFDLKDLTAEFVDCVADFCNDEEASKAILLKVLDDFTTCVEMLEQAAGDWLHVSK